ncbi:hypothetical protein ACWEO4_41520 [Streptomyces sp. NPDC004393]
MYLLFAHEPPARQPPRSSAPCSGGGAYVGWLFDVDAVGSGAEQLCAYVAGNKGMKGRGGKPVSPSTLRRYLLPFRVYTLWAQQRVRNEAPSLDAVARECAAHGITAQHNKPLTTDYIAEQAVDFERRWQGLTRHHAQLRQ